MSLKYDKLMRSLDFSIFVMFQHKVKSYTFNETLREDVELTIPNQNAIK